MKHKVRELVCKMKDVTLIQLRWVVSVSEIEFASCPTMFFQFYFPCKNRIKQFL